MAENDFKIGELQGELNGVKELLATMISAQAGYQEVNYTLLAKIDVKQDELADRVTDLEDDVDVFKVYAQKWKGGLAALVLIGSLVGITLKWLPALLGVGK